VSVLSIFNPSFERLPLVSYARIHLAVKLPIVNTRN